MAHHYIIPSKEDYVPETARVKIQEILSKNYSPWLSLSPSDSDSSTIVYRNNDPEAYRGRGVVIVRLSKSGAIPIEIKYPGATVITVDGDKKTENCGADAPFNILGSGEIYVSGFNEYQDGFKELDNEFRKLVK